MPLRIGFRGAVAAAAAALSLLTLGVAFAIVSVSVNRSQERQLDEALVSVADAEALDLSHNPDEGIVISDRPGPAANDVGPLPLFGALYAPDGRVLTATATFGGTPPAATLLVRSDRLPFDFTWNVQHLRGVLVALPAGRGRLLIAATRTDLDSDAAFLKRAMIFVFGVAVAWTVVVAFAIASRITRTHRTIVEIANRVSGGDLSARIGSAGRGGEMALLARNIDRMIDRLAVLLGNQQKFIAHAAHELRSPLTTLYGELSNAVRRPRDADEYRLAIEHALRSTRRLKDLAEDLLALARLGGKVPEGRERVHVTQAISDSVDQVSTEVTSRRLVVKVEGDEAWIDGRHNDLTRMFRNLFENAIRHSPEGGTISARVVPVGDVVIVHVSDEGPGIARDDAEAIFRPFIRRAADVSTASGSGLGLAIAREIARLHGGDLTVATQAAGRGATFEVKLPSAASSEPPTLRARDTH